MQGIQEILPPREARALESKPGSWTSWLGFQQQTCSFCWVDMVSGPALAVV